MSDDTHEIVTGRIANGDPSDGGAAPSAPRPPTIEALSRAAVEAPHSAGAWRRLGAAYRRQGNRRRATAAYARSITASFNDPELVQAGQALAKGDWTGAEAMVVGRLAREADDVVALRLHAELKLRAGHFQAAEALLRHCLSLAPTYPAARYSLATALFRQARLAEALHEIDLVLVTAPADPPARTLKAAIAASVGDSADSIALHRGLLAERPDQPAIWTSLGHSLRTIGQTEESIAAYRRAIALQPMSAEAYWSLANLKTIAFSAADVAAMRDLLARPDATAEDRIHLDFALGKALEDAGDPAGAFAHYRAGNAARRAGLRYDGDQVARSFARTARYFDAACVARHKGKGETAPDPIFIVGLPRSGSTLVEQILASHSRIEGTQELPYLDAMVHRLAQGGGAEQPSYPALLDDPARADLLALGREYLARARIHRKSARPFFIDKMPNNFVHAGLIRLILPNARIIDVRRHPLGACLSIYRQLFSHGQGFAYDLGETARYYRDYAALLDHFDAAMPGAIHRVHYEHLVHDTEGEARRLFDYLGLAFEPQCLRFYENDRPVRTPSSEQVRRPIFSDGVDQWRRHAAWLQPALAPLGALVRDYPDVAPPGTRLSTRSGD